MEPVIDNWLDGLQMDSIWIFYTCLECSPRFNGHFLDTKMMIRNKDYKLILFESLILVLNEHQDG